MKRKTPTSTGPVTIKQVAAKAGVSTATISRALAGKKAASPAVRNRVLRVAREMGYEPNRVAQSLRIRQRKVFGIVIPDLQNPFFTGIVRGVEEALHQAGYALLIANSDGSADREDNEIRILRAEGAAGLLLIPCRPEAEKYRNFDSTTCPVVAIDRVPAGWEIDSVKTANADGARLATEHLIRLGHVEIAMINGPAHYDVAQERLAGFQAAHTAYELTIPPEWVVHSNFRQQGGYEATKALLRCIRRPRALFLANYLMTLGALMAIYELGLRIPHDIAIVSFDDMPWSVALNPPLTAVAQPTRELGRTAAELLLARHADRARAVRQVVLQPRLVVRSSCGSVTARTEAPV